MSTTQKTMKAWQKPTESNVTKTFLSQHLRLKTFATSATNKSAVTVEVKDYNKTPVQSMLVKRPKWQDKEYRDAYMEASIEQGIAWQIRINRSLRGITQSDLASAIGTQQSAISRLEDPTYGAHSLETLVNIAKSFDCALSVKFISFSHLAYESEKLGESDLYAATFMEEMREIYDHQENQQIKHSPVTNCSSSKHIC
ncbi:helix-turn-helix domain-containing protein [Rhodoferax sp.]|uniref:helix-turn-helix domain-containing protein n=1 Tax=Rhodoferax sp. TaxID=50421 RepID=UPI0035247053